MKTALFLILAAVVTVAMGCGGSHPHPHASGPEGIDVVAANAQSVLRGRRLVFSLGRNLDNADIWEVSRGRIVNLTRSIRKDYPQQAEAPSLSPNGTYIAFFLQAVALGACTDCYPVPHFIRSDGSDAHPFGANLPFVGFSSFWAPSWDRSGRSIVIAAPKTGLQTNDPDVDEGFGDDDTGLFRFEIPSGREIELTQPGQDKYDYAAPTVSPDGRSIAFLRSATPEPSNYMRDGGVRAYVYVMSADGHGKRRLPLPPRGYSSLWWCRGNHSVCADTLKYVVPSAKSNTYRVDLQTGRIDRLRNWPEEAYVEFGALSRDASFAVSERTARNRAELLAGSLAAGGTARLKPVVIIPHTDGRHFFGVSISR